VLSLLILEICAFGFSAAELSLTDPNFLRSVLLENYSKYREKDLFERPNKDEASFPPIEIEHQGFLITREPTHNLISILPRARNTLPDALLSKYTEMGIAKEAIDRFVKDTANETTKNN
jgi:hypothetical protein